MIATATLTAPKQVPFNLERGTRRPPITSIRCLDGTWYFSLFGPKGTSVFAWREGAEAQRIGSMPLLDGYGWLQIGGNNTVYLWGFHQSQIHHAPIGRLESAFSTAGSFAPRPVVLQLYSNKVRPLNILSCKHCHDNSWYIAAFVGGDKSPKEGMWVFRWQEGGGAAQPVFNQPLTNGNGWLQIGGNQTVQLWAVQPLTSKTNEIVIRNIGPLSGAQTVGGVFSGKSIKVNLPFNGGNPYGHLSSLRCSDGSWYVSVFVVNKTNSSQEGTWVFKWTNNGSPATPLASGPIIRGTGNLALGAHTSVQLLGASDLTHEQLVYATLGPYS